MTLTRLLTFPIWRLKKCWRRSLVSDRNIDILRAKSAELENWQRHLVFDEVDDIGQTTVFSRWVVSQKYKNEDVTYKARLVAWGFEEDN